MIKGRNRALKEHERKAVAKAIVLFRQFKIHARLVAINLDAFQRDSDPNPRRKIYDGDGRFRRSGGIGRILSAFRDHGRSAQPTTGFKRVIEFRTSLNGRRRTVRAIGPGPSVSISQHRL